MQTSANCMHLSDLEEKRKKEATFLLLAAGQPRDGNAAAQSSCTVTVEAVSAHSDPPVPVLANTQPQLCHILTLAPPALPRFHKHLIPCINSHLV